MSSAGAQPSPVCDVQRLRPRGRGPHPARRPDHRLRLDGAGHQVSRALKRLLVAGAAGFIGSNFVRLLRGTRPDIEVTVLDKLTYAGNRANLLEFEGTEGYRFVHGDICDAGLVDTLAGQADAIVNFAAETHVDRSLMDPFAFIETDCLSTRTGRRYAITSSSRTTAGRSPRSFSTRRTRAHTTWARAPRPPAWRSRRRSSRSWPNPKASSSSSPTALATTIATPWTSRASPPSGGSRGSRSPRASSGPCAGTWSTRSGGAP